MPLSFHHHTWDSFTVEVTEKVDQVEVLQEERTVLADTLWQLSIFIVGYVSRREYVLESHMGLHDDQHGFDQVRGELELTRHGDAIAGGIEGLL